MVITSRRRAGALAGAWLWAAVLQPPHAAAQASATPGTGTLETLLSLAEAHHYRGALAEARSTLEQAAAVARRSTSPSKLARVWTARAGIWISQTTATNSGYAEADSAAVRAMEHAERSKEPRLIADAADVLGRVLYSRRINLGQGDYEAPLRQFERALKLRRGAGDERGVIEAMFRVGLIHERKDESAQAIAIYEEAMRMAGTRFPMERSNLARHLAYHRQGEGDLDLALELFTLSLELREQAGFLLTRPSALTSIGDLHRRRQDYPTALRFGRQALAEAERLGATRFVVGALISIGRTHGAAGEREAAVDNFSRAGALAEKIGYVSGVEQAREAAAGLPPASN
jgi:tetratricopeptide (TPR) repeat protein